MKIKTYIRQTIISTIIVFCLSTLIINAKQKIMSTDVISFGTGDDSNILFIGDSKSGSIHALKISDLENSSLNKGYNLIDFSKKLSEFIGTSIDKILVRDLAVNQKNKYAYIAISRITDDSYSPAIIAVNQEGVFKNIDLENSDYTSIKVKNAPANKEFSLYNRLSSSSLTFTDIDYHKNKIFISGLSNTDFASSLRVIKYPFNNDQQDITTLEIYHTMHNQNETRAPIRTMKVLNINGKDSILGAYTCTPLVTIPVEKLKDNAHVIGKTIAELGYGNTPIDLLQYTASDMKGNKFEVVLLINKNQSAQLIPLSEIEKSSLSKGLTDTILWKKRGVKFTDLPMTSISQADNQDENRILTLRINPDTSSYQLVSFLKNVYMRLSDFESEYDFPDFKYPPNSDFVKNFQNKLRIEENFSDHVVK